MPYFSEFITVIIVHLLGAMSPGPDFIMISRNSLVYSRRIGVFSALGLALGIIVHVTYSLVGIGFIISQSILLFSILKYAGAAYLVYIGYKSLRAKPAAVNVADFRVQRNLSSWGAVRMGFLTNVLNPKATLFFFAMFTQVISVETPKPIQVMYGFEMTIMTFVWFASVAMVLSHPFIRVRFGAIQHRLEQAFGAILIALGIKVALSSQK